MAQVKVKEAANVRHTGDLNTRVKLYRRDTETADGQSVDKLVELLPGGVWAEVYSQNDKTFAAGDARYMESVKFCTVRRPVAFELAPGMLFEHKGTLYEVKEVVPGAFRGTVKLRGVSIKTLGTGVMYDG